MKKIYLLMGLIIIMLCLGACANKKQKYTLTYADVRNALITNNMKVQRTPEGSKILDERNINIKVAMSEYVFVAKVVDYVETIYREDTYYQAAVKATNYPEKHIVNLVDKCSARTETVSIYDPNYKE